MLKRILVPLDTSCFAEQALPHAVMLARRAHAQLHLVCVRASMPLVLIGEQPEKYPVRIAAQVGPELPNAITHEIVADEESPLQPPDSHGVACVLSRYALTHGIDMMVMATHGWGGSRSAWLGSVADSLIRVASLPVLLIRPLDKAFGSNISADRGMRHIVVPLDGSHPAEQAFPCALQLGTLFGARYSLVRVTSRTTSGPYQPLAIPAAAPSRVDAAEYLVNVATQMRERGASVTIKCARRVLARSGDHALRGDARGRCDRPLHDGHRECPSAGARQRDGTRREQPWRTGTRLRQRPTGAGRKARNRRWCSRYLRMSASIGHSVRGAIRPVLVPVLSGERR
jgi:nucleotide-binding universal stress UspA family protein